METESVRTRPVFRRQLGSLSVSVWENSNSGGLSVKLQRSYRDPQGNWKTSDSLWAPDVPVAIVLLKSAQDWLLSRKASEAETEGT